jgi:hypothetical protein
MIGAALILFAVAAAPVEAGEAGPRGECYALLVSGLPGSTVYARRFRDWLERFHYYFTRHVGVPRENVVALSGEKGLDEGFVDGFADADSIREAFARIGGKAGPEDQFVLVLIGHGVVTEIPPAFVTKGPDLDARELARLLNGRMAVRNQVVINATSAAGHSLEYFTAGAPKGVERVYVSATSPKEANEPVFCEFLLRGLESKRADGEGAPGAGRRDGVVTVLEAYNWATRKTESWVSRQYQTKDGWKVEGTESVEIFKKLCVGPPGAYGAYGLSSESNPNVPDEGARTRDKGQASLKWANWRVLNEHSLLEDCGKEMGVSALEDANYEPLAGDEPGEPGYLAGRVVLGTPRLLEPK